MSRWTSCQNQTRGSTADMTRLQVDGRIYFVYSELGDGQTMLTCLRNAGKDGPALPEPIAEPRRGGGGGGGM